MALARFADWLATPAGQHLLAWERDKLDGIVADIFGFNAAQIGLPQIDFLRANRIPFRFHCGEGGGASIVADPHHLPFAANSLDLVVLPHQLEFADHPHQVLREVERILAPEGSVVVIGFNPYSLWGIRRWLARQSGEPPWQGRYISTHRLRDWLALLGFETRAGVFGCYVPPMKSGKWLTRLRFFDTIGDRWWAVFGAVYIIQAIKRQLGLRLLMPKWKERIARARALALVPPKPLTQKDGE